MNLATLIGLVLGIVLIGYASMLSAAGAGLGLGALWDLVSLLIVVGGALAATAVALHGRTLPACYTGPYRAAPGRAC